MVTRLSTRLKELRRIASLSTTEVIKELKHSNLDYSEQSIYKWEQGNAVPSINIIIALAKIYKCNISYLLDEDEKELNKVTNNESIILKQFRNDYLFRCIANLLIRMSNRKV